MKKKEQKRFESTAFILLEVLAKAVEMKKLQLEEKKLDIDREMWLEKRSGQKVGSEVPKLKFPSGGFTENAENWTGKIVGTGLLNDEKEFVIPKSLFPIQGEKLTVVNDKPVSRNSNYKSLIQYLEESVKNGTIKSVNWDCGGFKGGMDFGQEDVQKMVFYDLNRLAKLPSEIHEEALENGLKTEKKCETASELLKEKESFEFPKRNFDYLDNEDYFAVREGLVNVFLESNNKQLFFFNDRDSKKIILIKNDEQADFAKRNKKEIYFKWVRR